MKDRLVEGKQSSTYRILHQDTDSSFNWNVLESYILEALDWKLLQPTIDDFFHILLTLTRVELSLSQKTRCHHVLDGCMAICSGRSSILAAIGLLLVHDYGHISTSETVIRDVLQSLYTPQQLVLPNSPGLGFRLSIPHQVLLSRPCLLTVL